MLGCALEAAPRLAACEHRSEHTLFDGREDHVLHLVFELVAHRLRRRAYVASIVKPEPNAARTSSAARTTKHMTVAPNRRIFGFMPTPIGVCVYHGHVYALGVSNGRKPHGS